MRSTREASFCLRHSEQGRCGGNHPSFIQGGNAAAAGEVPVGGARPSSADDRIVLVVAAYRTSDGSRLWEHKLAAEGVGFVSCW